MAEKKLQIEAISTLIDVSHTQMAQCREETRIHQTTIANRMIKTLKGMDSFYQGFAISQLEHMLQSATRAYKDNANDEIVFALLCHDAGKAFSVLNHDEAIAAMLKPYISKHTYFILKHHQAFQGKFYYDKLGKDSKEYLEFQSEDWFSDALIFAQEWDAPAFDPKYKCMRLEEFLPLIHRFLVPFK